MQKKYLLIILCIILIFTTLRADPPNWVPITGTLYSMVVMAQITLYGELFEGVGTNMTASFGPGGETDCRGLAFWQDPNPPYWDGYWYFTIVGNINGEEICFKIYDEVTDAIYDCNETITFENNATIGSAADPFELTAQSGTIEGNVALITTTPPQGNIENVEVTAGIFTVNPDMNGDYQITIAPGTYDVTASLNGYTTVTIEDIIVEANQTVDSLDITLIDWMPIDGTQYNMVLIATVTLRNEFLDNTGSNQVAAFGPGGDEDCRGIALWEEASPPYWDGYWYFTIVGNIQGELINFKIFDDETSTIYDCSESIIFEDGSTIGEPSNPFELTININQEFSLGADWNWLSFNITPDDPLIDSVFAPLGNNIYQVKNQNQSATYYDPPGTWVGDLTQITDGEGYLVNMNNPIDTFTVLGMPIDLLTPIELTQDWNWIAYFPQIPQSIENALISIEPNAFQIKNQNQSATYYNPPGVWVGDLTQMEPGICYKLKMTVADILLYPEPRSDSAYPINITLRNPPNWVPITGTEYSMVLMARILFDNNTFEGIDENMAGAFGPGGESDCRSVAVWVDPYPPYWEGYWYFTIIGNTNGEEISFKIYNDSTDVIYDCNETIIFEDGATIGIPSDPYILTAFPPFVDDPGHNLTFNLNQNTPNPFNPDKIGTYISYSLPKSCNVKLQIYNVKGQLVTTLIDEYKPAGYHSVYWNVKDMSSGIYFYKLHTDTLTSIKRCLILK